MPRQFPPEFRQRAWRMLEEALPEHETEYAAIRHVIARLGVGQDAAQMASPMPRSIRSGVSTERTTGRSRSP